MNRRKNNKRKTRRLASVDSPISLPRSDEVSQTERDPYGHFRDVCTIYGDHLDLRPIFVEEIESFIRNASRTEIETIRHAVQVRTRSLRGHGKKGRPSAQDDDRLAHKARIVAWHAHVDGWHWEKIAKAVGMQVIKPNKSYDGNEATVRRALQRLNDSLAAKIFFAIPPSYVVHQGNESRRLRPGALEHKPLQQMIWSKASLPFRTHPEECKRIVEALWPRAIRAASEQIDREMRYLKKKASQ